MDIKKKMLVQTHKDGTKTFFPYAVINGVCKYMAYVTAEPAGKYNAYVFSIESKRAHPFKSEFIARMALEEAINKHERQLKYKEDKKVVSHQILNVA